MQTAIYLRKSRADEELENQGQGETLARHRSILLEFASKNDLLIIEIYEEIVSGENVISRPQMLRLLQDVEDGKYNAVLCMDIDRLGRGNMQDQGLILETLKRSKTLIITPRKVYDLNDEFDEEYSEFEAFMARKELKIIKRRLRSGIMRSIDEGCYMPIPPFGYVKTKINGKPSITPHPEHAEVVRMIFDMYTNQQKTPIDIAKTLNNLGYRTMHEKSWIPATVRHLLKNPTYTGKIVWKRYDRTRTNDGKIKSKKNPRENWLIKDGLHEAIIDTDLFHRTQERIENRCTPPTFDGKIKNPLAGLVRCKMCGFTMTRRPYKSKEAHYVCPYACENKSSRADYIEARIIKMLENWLKEYDVPFAPSKSGALDHTNIHQTTLKRQEASLEKLITQQKNLHDLLEQGVYDVSKYLERSKDISERIITVKAEISTLQKELNNYPQTDNSILAPNIRCALEIYPSLSDPTEKNRMLKSVINQVIYYKSKPQKNEEFELILFPKVLG